MYDMIILIFYGNILKVIMYVNFLFWSIIGEDWLVNGFNDDRLMIIIIIF